MSLEKLLFLLLVCFCLTGCSKTAVVALSDIAKEQPETGIYGQVTNVVAGASAVWVYAYRTQQNSFRGPADFAARVDADGHYLLDLLPGRWYLVARSRQQGPMTGPPQKGDAWAVYADNPVVIAQHEVRRILLPLRAVAATMLLRGGALSSGETGFKGRLLGPGKKPVVGAFAFAYKNADYQRMPDHGSAAATQDGSFSLFVAEPGRYCLAARQGTRGQPVQGELYGLLGSGALGCREIEAGEMLDIGEIYLTPYLR